MKIETKYNIGDWVYFMVITYSEGKAIGESFVRSQVDGIFIDEIKENSQASVIIWYHVKFDESNTRKRQQCYLAKTIEDLTYEES